MTIVEILSKNELNEKGTLFTVLMKCKISMPSSSDQFWLFKEKKQIGFRVISKHTHGIKYTRHK